MGERWKVKGQGERWKVKRWKVKGESLRAGRQGERWKSKKHKITGIQKICTSYFTFAAEPETNDEKQYSSNQELEILHLLKVFYIKSSTQLQAHTFYINPGFITDNI